MISRLAVYINAYIIASYLANRNLLLLVYEIFMHTAPKGSMSACADGKGSEIKKFFEFLVQRDAQNQRQLGGRTELSGLDGTDRVPGHTDHLG